MTDKDKSLLKRIMEREPETSNADAADECNCSVGTAQKYRRWFAPKPDAPVQP